MSTTPPLAPNPAALAFLLSRRSRPPRMIGGAAPDPATVQKILTAAARVPDHGKLEPFRFLVIQGAARARLSEAMARHGARRGEDPDRLARQIAPIRDAPLTVAVIAAPKPSEKIPLTEQFATAACACLSAVNAALASGWGAAWLTGWAAEDRAFMENELGLFPHETVAGYIHIGEELRAPLDRPRPDIGALTTWMEE